MKLSTILKAAAVIGVGYLAYQALTGGEGEVEIPEAPAVPELPAPEDVIVEQSA
uniref:Uncharacterized protein n=1 Tax=Pseudomonas phage RVTF4 TaxID=3236931 RepID=A0AB39CD59_9VIRU